MQATDQPPTIPTLVTADLFSEPLRRWEQPGDPILWDAFARQFATADWPVSAESFHTQLISAFTSLTGHPIEGDTPFVVNQAADQQLAACLISPRFWRITAIGILLKRYRIAVWRREHALERLAD